MRLFGKCIWHRWKKKSIYYDCFDICIWSSGTVHYRKCKDCGILEDRKYYEKTYSLSTHKNIEI